MAESAPPSTPKNRIIRKLINSTPAGKGVPSSPALHIPATPYLKKLGFGTGVCVYLYERSPKAGKVMSPWAVKRVNRTHENSQFSKRLEEEAKILRTLDHPNIIGYRGFQATAAAGPKNLAMEVGTIALLNLIDERKESMDGDLPFPAQDIEKVLRWTGLGLDYLHTQRSLMHGDIKSANLLILGPFTNLKICDFGVTVAVDGAGQALPDALYIGTDAWSPPEVVHGEEVITTKADVFALGLVVFEMLALHPPHIDKLGGDEDEFGGDSTFNDTYDSMEDEEDSSGDESFDDSAYRAALGTRPALPANLRLDQAYSRTMEAFVVMTLEEPQLRPAAKDVVAMMEAEPKAKTDDYMYNIN